MPCSAETPACEGQQLPRVPWHHDPKFHICPKIRDEELPSILGHALDACYDSKLKLTTSDLVVPLIVRTKEALAD